MTKTSAVTVAIPTFKRPELLQRCLDSIASQDYCNLEVLVSDNDSSMSAKEVVLKFSDKLAVTYFSHGSNIGSLNNFMFLLEKSSGDYFMWLADDDELMGSNYISSLVNILDNNDAAITAFAEWKLMDAAHLQVPIKSKEYVSGSWVIRALSFIFFAHDDFFYGLHRKKWLKQAVVTNLSWPNASVLTNTAYPYLLELVIRGKVVLCPDPMIGWINHDYTDKNYISQSGRSHLSRLFFVLFRRINIHILYLVKINKIKGWSFLPLFALWSGLALCFEGIRFFSSVRRVDR